MNFQNMSDSAVATEIGQRIEQMRLERNMTQQEVADAAGVSRKTYGKLVSGEAKLLNVIAVLRYMDQLSLLESAFPESTFSPMAQLELQGKKRQRATGSRGQTGSDANESDDLDW